MDQLIHYEYLLGGKIELKLDHSVKFTPGQILSTFYSTTAVCFFCPDMQLKAFVIVSQLW